VRSAVRPDAAAWQQALEQAEQALAACPVNSQHVYHHGLTACPWCELARRQGRDPFPSKEDVQAGKVEAQPAMAQTPLPAAGTLPAARATPSPASWAASPPPLPAAGLGRPSDQVLELEIMQETPPAPVPGRRGPSRDFPEPEQKSRSYLAVYLGLGGVAVLLLGLLVYFLMPSPQR